VTLQKGFEETDLTSSKKHSIRNNNIWDCNEAYCEKCFICEDSEYGGEIWYRHRGYGIWAHAKLVGGNFSMVIFCYLYSRRESVELKCQKMSEVAVS
jgi:hypothetical protein